MAVCLNILANIGFGEKVSDSQMTRLPRKLEVSFWVLRRCEGFKKFLLALEELFQD